LFEVHMRFLAWRNDKKNFVTSTQRAFLKTNEFVAAETVALFHTALG